MVGSIKDYVLGPARRDDSLANLQPPHGPIHVDWQRNMDWIHDPRNAHWIDHGPEGLERIDPRFEA